MELSWTYILTLKFKMSVMDGLSKKMWSFLINALYKFSGIHYLFMNNNEITIFYNFIVINWYINIIIILLHPCALQLSMGEILFQLCMGRSSHLNKVMLVDINKKY